MALHHVHGDSSKRSDGLVIECKLGTGSAVFDAGCDEVLIARPRL
ncbi:hypothetical protein CGRA01v4_10910 [Colletotrichum graminicola]|nr:hypothetical protein CGRA01v4_10910 [Colletotrichum graminicola]